MKKILSIFIILLVAGLILGCEDKTEMKSGSDAASDGSGSADASGADDSSDDSGPGLMDKVKAKASGKYIGFMGWKEGMWAEYNMPGNMRTRWDIVKMDSDKIIFQMASSVGGDTRVSQMWMDPDTKEPLKYVMDMNGQIVCLDMGEAPKDSVPNDGSEYPADAPNIRYDSYTTPTGKKVDSAVYDMKGMGEVWVSSDVPFGMVMVDTSQGATMELYDFGTSGARSRISESKAENCLTMEQMATQMMASQQNDAYQDYVQSEDADLEAEATYRGQTQDIDCSMCDGMPPAAMNACLASCGG